MHREDCGLTVPAANLAEQDASEQPPQPTLRFVQAFQGVESAIEDLDAVVAQLLGHEQDDRGAQGRQTPSAVDVIRQYPEELEVVAKRIYVQAERLRDGFLTP